MHRIDWYVAHCEVFVKVSLGGDVPAAPFQPHLDRKRATLRHRRYMNIGIEDFYLSVGLYLAREHFARRPPLDSQGLWTCSVEPERNSLQVQDYVRCVFNYARYRRELVQDSFDLHRSDGRSLY